MDAVINVEAIRASAPSDIANHFREAFSRASIESVTLALLEAVERGALVPSIFTIWLGVARSPIAIRLALQQNISVEIRYIGIKFLGKELRSTRWRETWHGIGVAGVLEIMSDLSVHEVRAICKVIGTSAKTHEVEEKREAVTQLLEALFPRFFPDASLRTPDQRPLAKHYQRLVPSCTPQRVESLLDPDFQGDWANVEPKRLCQYQSTTLQGIAGRMAFKKSEAPSWLPLLFQEYPPTPGTQPKFSASMEFSLNFLRNVVEEDSSPIPDNLFFRVVAEPLLSRAMRKKVAWSSKLEIINLTIRYLEKYPKAARYLRHVYMRYVARCWIRNEGEFSDQFRMLLLLHLVNYNATTIGGFEVFLDGIAKSQRYSLLRFCYQQVTGRDIDEESDLKDEGPLPYSILTKLPPEQALQLLNRLRNARGAQNLVKTSDSTSIAYLTPGRNEYSQSDPDLIRILFMDQVGDSSAAETLAVANIEDRKKTAMTSSNQDLRAWYARSTIYYAVASGSLKLLKDVTIWAQRFIRDAQTVSLLWGFYPREYKVLLGAIPTKTNNLGLATLQSRIEEANSILQILFETACLQLREPSFSSYSWSSTFQLFFETVHLRLKRSKELQHVLGLSDNDIYNTVWKDTLRLLLHVEEEALKPGHDRLGIDTLGGILEFERGQPTGVNDESPAIYRFFDELARGRDEIWRRARPTKYPAAATLPEPYPRGLPVQSLTGAFNILTPHLESAAPYLATRVHSTVFLDPAKAFTPYPEDEDTQDAIGYFIDDYIYALEMYIPQDLDKDEKKSRLNQAWTHAVGPLSNPRMSSEEGSRYWRYEGYDYYTEFWPLAHFHESEVREAFSEIRNWPLVPAVDEPSEVVEWNPVPPEEPALKERSLDMVAYVDLMKAISRLRSNRQKINNKIDPFTPEVPGEHFEEEGLWSYARIARAEKVDKMREGQILSALLFLDSSNAARTRILSSPFPSIKEPRFPSAYLDEYFLTKGILKTDGEALHTLRAHIKNIPPVLLVQLAQNTVDTLETMGSDDTKSINIESMAFELIKLLALSDRPNLASELAIGRILTRPAASSWHRKLLSPTIFRRLSASDAKACFNSFVTAIVRKLEEQSKARKDTAEEREHLPDQGQPVTHNANPQQPLVKVTTVKFLAQLLRDTDFVSEDFSISVLSTLSQKASHADIKRAVVDSLLNMMLSSSIPELQERIITALECILPMTGNLNERRPIMEEDWTAAREEKVPPQIAIDGYDNTPMLGSFLEFLRISPDDSVYRRAYTDRIILPLLSSLKSQMRKWLAVFLYSIDAPAALIDHLPIVPRTQRIWKALLDQNLQYMPVSVLEEYVQYTIFAMKPHPNVIEINKHIQSDTSLREKIDVRPWLEIYGVGCGVLDRGENVPLPDFLGKKSKLSYNEGGITDKKVQELFLNMFTATLWSDTSEYRWVQHLTAQLRPHNHDEEWLEYKKPVVEAIVLFVDSLRTREWQRDPKRQPSTLPDTFPLRLWLLKYPSMPGLPATPEANCQSYTDQISPIVEKLAGTIYHRKLAQIKESFTFLSHYEKIVVGLQLGDITKTKLSWLSMPDILRVELASELICIAEANYLDHEELEALRPRVEALKTLWKQSENEEVRRLGEKTILKEGFGLFD
jgi:hypothetical protein